MCNILCKYFVFIQNIFLTFYILHAVVYDAALKNRPKCLSAVTNLVTQTKLGQFEQRVVMGIRFLVSK